MVARAEPTALLIWYNSLFHQRISSPFCWIAIKMQRQFSYTWVDFLDKICHCDRHGHFKYYGIAGIRTWVNEYILQPYRGCSNIPWCNFHLRLNLTTFEVKSYVSNNMLWFYLDAIISLSPNTYASYTSFMPVSINKLVPSNLATWISYSCTMLFNDISITQNRIIVLFTEWQAPLA